VRGTMGKKSISTAIVALVLAGALPALAASVSGVVMDAGGKRVAGVKVIAHDARGAPLTSAVSSANGEYTLTLDPDANYRFALDPGSLGFKIGAPVGAFVPRNGITLNWVVSPSADPLAYAHPAPASQLAADDPAADPPPIPEDVALGIGAVGIVAAGTVGGVAAAGGFNGNNGNNSVVSSSK
jgi:hypothetical protein